AQGIRKPALDTTVFMGLFTAYLVVTALTTVRPPSAWTRRLDLIGLPVVCAVAVGLVTLGIRAISGMAGPQASMITWVELIFGSVALIAAASDLRILRSVPLTGTKRIARH